MKPKRMSFSMFDRLINDSKQKKLFSRLYEFVLFSIPNNELLNCGNFQLKKKFVITYLLLLYRHKQN